MKKGMSGGQTTMPKRKTKELKVIQIEKLSQASEAREACIACGLCEIASRPFLQPYVPEGYTGKFVIVGDATKAFEATGNPYKGTAGEQLKHVLQQSGIHKQDVAFVPLVRCKPRGTLKMKQIRNCAPFLFRAIEQLKGKLLVGMGKNAARALANQGSATNSAKRRGREQKITVMDIGILPVSFLYKVTSGIAQLETSPAEVDRCIEDFRRYSRPLLPIPKNDLPRRGEGMTYLGFDTEFTPSEVLCGAISDGNAATTIEAKKLRAVAGMLSESILVGHNIGVDLDALLKLRIPGLQVALETWLQGRRQRDTLLMAKLADENRGKGGYMLESLLLAHYNAADYKAPTEALGPDPTLWAVPLRDERCRLDAWATLKVYEATKEHVRGPVALSHMIAMSLRRMQHAGVYVSLKKFHTMKKEVYAEESSAAKKLLGFARKHGMPDFAPSKDADVRTFVYEKLGIPVETYTKSALPSASVKVLREYKDKFPEIKALVEYSKADKLKTTYVDGLEPRLVRLSDGRAWMPVQINALAAKTGRRSSMSPNFQNLPPRVRQIIVSRFKGGSIADNDYCVDPATRVLCADLTWKEASALVVGQEIVAFDEHGTKEAPRCTRKTVVTSLKQLARPTVRVCTDKGSVVCSVEHRWLVKSSTKHVFDWKRADAIVPGDLVAYYASPWETERSHAAGYLAGILDGEGWASNGGVGYGQNPGAVSDTVNGLLRARGFVVKTYCSSKHSCEQHHISGSVGDRLRLLGSIRPARLLSKAETVWRDKKVGGKWSTPAVVQQVQAVARQGKVIAIGTETGTFIAEGFLSHNSKLEPISGGWVMNEPRLTDYFVKYSNGYIKIGEDFFKKSVEKNTSEYTAVKSLVLAVIYNQQRWSLAENLWVGQNVKLDSNYERHVEKTGELLNRFLRELFPGVKRYHQAQEAFVLEYGYVDNALGQRRHLPLPPMPDKSDMMKYKLYRRYQAHVVSQAINYPVQSLAAAITGSALVDLEAAFLRQYKWSYVDYQTALLNKDWPQMPLLCIEVHDDLVQDVPKGFEKTAKEVTHEIMRKPPTLVALLPELFDSNVNLTVDTNYGPCWGMKG